MTLSSTCACSLQVVDAGVSTEILCEIVIVVRSNLTLFLQKTQLLALLGPSTRLKNLQQNDHLTALELRRGLILPAFNIAVPGPAQGKLSLYVHETISFSEW